MPLHVGPVFPYPPLVNMPFPSARGVGVGDGGVSICSLSHTKPLPEAVILVFASRWEPKIEREGWPAFLRPPSFQERFCALRIRYLELAHGLWIYHHCY